MSNLQFIPYISMIIKTSILLMLLQIFLMLLFNNMDPQKNNPLVRPPKKEHLHTIVWIHGLKETPQLHVNIFEHEIFDNFKIILPRAPTAFVTVGNNSYTSWYDIKFRSEKSFTVPFDEAFSSEQALLNFEKILKPILLEQKKQLMNLGKNGKLIVGGFSQGCGMSLHSFYEMPETIDAIIGISGYLFPFSKFNRDDKRRLRVLYGNADILRPWEYVKVVYQGKLSQQNGDIIIVPETGHEVNDKMQQRLREFLGLLIK